MWFGVTCRAHVSLSPCPSVPVRSRFVLFENLYASAILARAICLIFKKNVLLRLFAFIFSIPASAIELVFSMTALLLYHTTGYRVPRMHIAVLLCLTCWGPASS